MNSPFFNNLKPIQFYFISIILFVIANLVRDTNLSIYYILIIIGVISFVLGLMKRMKNS